MRAITKLLLCIIIFFAPFGGHAAKKDSTIVLKPYAPAEVRKPSAEKIAKFKQDRDFIYETDYSAKISIWDIIGNWLNKHFFAPIIGKHAFTIWQVIEYSLAIIAVILIVYYFIKGDRRGLFSRGPKNLSIEMEGTEEDINLMNFDKLIADSISNGQYRVAIRYLYLKILKDLADKNHINWKAEKTNLDYMNELRSTAYGKGFMEVTFLFDYAWYGDASITESSFGLIKNSFSDFNKQLQQ
jgi:hypothetical protein